MPPDYYTNNEIINATTKPVKPTSVSMIVHVFRVVFSSRPTSDFTSQKPELLKCEHTVEPPATAATVHARYNGERSAIPGIAAMIPAAIVIATVAEPTQILTRAATRTATKGDISPGKCCPSAIANALKQLNNNFVINHVFEQHPIEEPKENNKPKCPICGKELAHTGGCITCFECGYSRCD